MDKDFEGIGKRTKREGTERILLSSRW